MAAHRKVVRVRIEGRVQGVGFRGWVQLQAAGLGLDGWVANRRDGGVEAVFAGPTGHVDGMIAQCHQGPPAAEVAMVKVLDETEAVAPGFMVHPTR